MQRSKNFLLIEAIATLIGTIIGAGIFGIPYVFNQSGFWTGTLALMVVGLAMILMKFMYGEIALRTPGIHQIAGYTGIYLGKIAKRVISLILIFSFYGALLVYFIGTGEVIGALTGMPAIWSGLGFFVVFSIFIYFGITLTKRVELVMTIFMLIAMVGIGVLSFRQIELTNLSGWHWDLFFIPYGVLIFACSGTEAVPQVRQILKGAEHKMKSALGWGCAIPQVVYWLFVALVISVSGAKVTEVASVGLGELFGWQMILVANIFAFFAMATSFLVLGLALIEIYKFDYKLSGPTAWLLTVSVPLAAFF
ncbi:hypothetical protein GW853_00280 [Candidatus Kuenenbacteria bacterium]|nr:hypothetical protein [Candidatus Kuenenbacteria bacterium]